MPDVANLTVKVSADTSDAEKGLDSLGSKIGGVGSSIATAFGGAAIAGLAGLAAGIGASVVAAADFEKTMSAVKAVSGATGDEMQSLSDLALQLGKDTSFSASEAGKEIEELVKGGLTIPDIMNGAAKATLDLAAAGGVSLPEAATIAANALAQFNLKGEDMGHVADLIAGAANASALDVSDFSFSLKAAGAVASTVGFSFDDLAQGIAVMGKAGITGSDAGTSLKTMMLNLQPATNAQRDLFRDLGITTLNSAKAMEAFKTLGMQPVTGSLAEQEKALKMAVTGWDGIKKITADQEKAWITGADKLRIYDNAFFDANGSVRSMGEVAQVLQTSLAGMTDAQRLATLETMFGSDAIRAGAVLAKEGAAGFEEMAASMGKVTAEAVGAERLNNLSGSFEQLKGSLETAAITLGMSLLPVLNDLTKWATKGINDIIPGLDSLGKAFASAVTFLTTDGEAAQKAFMDFSVTVEKAFGPELSATIIETMADIRNTIDVTVQAINQVFNANGTEMATSWNNTWGQIVRDTAFQTQQLLAAIRIVAFTIKGDWESVWEEIVLMDERASAQRVKVAEQQSEMLLKSIDLFTGGALSALTKWADDSGKATREAWDAMVDATTTGTTNALKPITETWNEAQRITETVFKAIQNTLTAIWGAIYDSVIKPKVDAISTVISTVWEAVQSKTKEVFDAVLAYLRDTIFEPIRAVIETKVNAARDLVVGAWQAISDKATAILGPVLTYVRDTIFEPMRAAVDTAMYGQKGVHTQFEGALKSVEGVVNTVLQAVKGTWESTWTAIQRAAESPQQAMKVLIELVDKLRGIMPDWLIPHSPTPFQIGLEGIMKAARGMDSAFGDMTSVDGWLRAAIKLAGVGEDWLPGLSRLVGWESTGNPRAVNPTSVAGQHATGLLQTLPSTFRAHALPGMDDIFNPIHNAVSAIRYILDTYGSVYRIPGIASGNHAEFPGYGEGGIAWSPQLAMVGEREPEAIIPRSWFGQGGGGGMQEHHFIVRDPAGQTLADWYVTGREVAIRYGRATS